MTENRITSPASEQAVRELVERLKAAMRAGPCGWSEIACAALAFAAEQRAGPCPCSRCPICHGEQRDFKPGDRVRMRGGMGGFELTVEVNHNGWYCRAIDSEGRPRHINMNFLERLPVQQPVPPASYAPHTERTDILNQVDRMFPTIKALRHAFDCLRGARCEGGTCQLCDGRWEAEQGAAERQPAPPALAATPPPEPQQQAGEGGRSYGEASWRAAAQQAAEQIADLRGRIADAIERLSTPGGALSHERRMEIARQDAEGDLKEARRECSDLRERSEWAAGLLAEHKAFVVGPLPTTGYLSLYDLAAVLRGEKPVPGGDDTTGARR